MRTVLTHALIAAGIGLLALPASAQQACREGRTFAGACVNPDLARDLRTGTIVFSQPKLSITNPPNLPYQDGLYWVPRDRHEIRNLHGNPPVSSPFGNLIYTSPGRPTSPVTTGPLP
jgi:hypothetical protein